MLKRLLGITLCVVIALGVVSEAKAIFIASNGTIQMLDPLPVVTGPPLTDITELGAPAGFGYTNEIHTVGPQGTPGNLIRTVTVNQVSNSINGTNTPTTLPDFTNLLVISAVEGNLIPGGGVTFNQGRAFLASDFTGNPETFDIIDPSSWNFGNIFAEFALKQREAIIKGPGVDSGSAQNIPAGLVNISSINAINPLQFQGILLFREDSTAAQNAGIGFVNPGLGAFTGDTFLRDVEVSPAFSVKADEGFYTDVDETIAPVESLDAADIAALNAIATAGIGALFDDPGFPGVGGTGAYVPSVTPFAAQGDFNFTFSSETFLGYQPPIPEPGTLALLGFGVVMGLVGRVRRNRK